ncbi:putative dehydrogenase [Streptomyces sp. DSM 42143]|uniref:Gfo/Idh/MocA family protein n=1 Tax=Streptomyces sp. DSM 42143 TaxID=2817711 RepID=UPI00277E87DD|nr:Gfo/Idh/MocA family oxidoreductase [Streptomyces sp. DSM 42143]MDQ0383277.1 putative dehydrogenase [Streptomyces sp. DSM 42143]
MRPPSFRQLPPGSGPLRVLVVGAGAMARLWLRAILASPDTELAGVVDLVPAAAETLVRRAGVPGVPTGHDLAALVAATRPDAVVDVTVPEAHLPVTLQALSLGLPVLGEKPVAATVPEALRLAAASEAAGELFMVSQSRRYHRHLAAFRVRARLLGRHGILTTDFFRAPRFGGFRETMAQPLLLDMAIHAFDTARWFLDAEPVSVRCESYNPSWSWYAGDAAATAVFEMTGGTRYVYNGSWCSPGLETSWNGAWRLSGELGSVSWDGEHPPEAEFRDADAVPLVEGGNGLEACGPEGVAGALAEFVHALRTGVTPSGEVHGNVLSLAMVSAAVASAHTDRRVHIESLLDEALTEALTVATGPEAARLRAWPSAGEALTVTPRGLHRAG